MARFPYHEKNVKALGRLLATAATDKKVLARLKSDPSSCLAEIGLPEQTTKLIDFQVVDQRNEPRAIALPYKLNAEKLRHADPSYLTGLSRMFTLN